MKKETIFVAMLFSLQILGQTSDIIKYDSRGLPHKVGEIKQGRNGEMDVYIMNKSNLMEKTKTIVPSRRGADVYEIRKDGLPYLEKTIKSPYSDFLNRLESTR